MRNSRDLTAWLINLIHLNRIHEFYVSPEWRARRRKLIKQGHYECQQCKEKGGVSAEGEDGITLVVHHIKPLRLRPDLALDPDNLVVLCDKCHYKIHHPNCTAIKWDDERW